MDRLHIRMWCLRMWCLGGGLCLALALSGCDFTPDFGDLAAARELTEAPTEPACEGERLLCTVSGEAGVAGGGGDGGPALLARLDTPVDVVMAPMTMAQTGDVYIVDAGNHSVRRIDATGQIDRVVGTGEAGRATEGPARESSLENPASAVIGPDGRLWVAGWRDARVAVADVDAGVVVRVLGHDDGFAGDGGTAQGVRFSLPSGLAFDPDGILYIADQGNDRIRALGLSDSVSTFAGSGRGDADGPRETAAFYLGAGTGWGPGGRISMNTHDWVLYVADTENHRIRRVNFFTGQVTTIAGTGTPGYSGDGGSARAARLNRPTDVIFTEDHRVYIADSGNHVIRKIDAFGTISTVAGTGEAGWSPDGTPVAEARLNRPMGLFYDEVNRVVYVADTDNHQVRRFRDPF